MDIDKTYFLLILVLGIALIFPIFYTDVIAYNSNKTIGSFIDAYPVILVVLVSFIVGAVGLKKVVG